MARTPRTKAAPKPALGGPDTATQDTSAAATAGNAPPPAGAEKPGASGETAGSAGPQPAVVHSAGAGAQTPAEPGSRPDEGQGGAGEGGGGAPSPEAPGQTSGLIVWVTGPKAGRWRIGRQFGPDPIGIPLDELTEEQKAALIADPKLQTEIYALPGTAS